MELAWGPRDLTAQRRYPQRNQHLHWGRDKTPLFSPESRRPPSPQLSILPKAARIPELRAASGASSRCSPPPPRLLVALGDLAARGEMQGSNGAAVPREKLEASGKEEERSAGARGWAPPAACLRPLHSALVPARGGGGGSRADVTAGRARPRRRRWEPLGARRSRAPPGASAPSPPSPPSAAFSRAAGGAGRLESGCSPA